MAKQQARAIDGGGIEHRKPFERQAVRQRKAHQFVIFDDQMVWPLSGCFCGTAYLPWNSDAKQGAEAGLTFDFDSPLH